ncbi:MFS transporter, partial [Microbispora triticiradicis]|nr:MFS transporter [Microbispora triticiradicis]
AASWTEGLLADGASGAVALTGGYRLAFTVSFGLLIAAFAVGLLVLRRPKADVGHEAALQPERA